ncbi:histidine phosphatase family protein [Parvularcula dongshanensis]|uniref:Broad specificity phosphatase PhoE n=1 Tax=Parvularcula dongshanensis TaxID=1173995 RepID=A0A840I2Y1_9PROT|nr:histidine phosphatase family protein [Parvularcula dongshanensis]MBB4659199.1 broad specificity phosphatase PhoE [Parvularcula dongshanensis]
MAGRIITARHGKPNLDRNVKITAREYGEWWSRYDEAGLEPGQHPPQSLVDLAAECEVVLCSTLPRAIETADAIVNGARIVPRNALFIEAPLPPPPLPFIKLSPTAWGRVSRAFWFMGYAPRGVESHRQAHKRVRRIADYLINEAQDGDDVLLCAHGYLNWMFDNHITKRGWQRIVHDGENEYWSYRAYRLLAPQLQETAEAALGAPAAE